MNLLLQNLFPGIGTSGLRGTGFLFGCGTSKDAGYPLTCELTKQVIKSLGASPRATLDHVLSRSKIVYDDTKGEPDIEVIADEVMSANYAAHSADLDDLEYRIKALIIEIILSCFPNHDLSLHIRFFEALKRFGCRESYPLWIFTTNYDPLFELAAEEARVNLVTGFGGALERYFDVQRFHQVAGIISGKKFSELNQLRVNLLKLHGSVTWAESSRGVRESARNLAPGSAGHCLVLPRRSKIIDTLGNPYDNLFACAHSALGSSTKYIVSCGFGFRDQHITDRILQPSLSEGKIRLVALAGSDAASLGHLTSNQTFNFVCPQESRIDGQLTNQGSDLWRFDKLVELLEQ